MRNAVTPVEVRRWLAGQPTVRKAQSLGGNLSDREANPGGRKTTGNRDLGRPLHAGRGWITGRIRDVVPGPKSVLTRSGEPLKSKMTKPRNRRTSWTPRRTVVVNGPEDTTLDWRRQVDWRTAETSVRRLRQRIFTASQAGDLPRVRSLQKLMLRSRANTLVSVRRVTERNAGRLTAGVDGEMVLTPEAKMRLVERIQRGTEPFTAHPTKPSSWAIARHSSQFNKSN